MQDRITEMLVITRLDRLQSRWAGAISGGMKNKLALACALVGEPEVFIRDDLPLELIRCTGEGYGSS